MSEHKQVNKWEGKWEENERKEMQLQTGVSYSGGSTVIHSTLLPNGMGELRNRKLEALNGTKLHKRSEGRARVVQKIKHENLQTNYFFFDFL